MKDKSYRKFYLFSLAGVTALSAYPIYMGILAVNEMLRNGAIPMERYPKYIIPYTPISVALILGVLLLPLFQKLGKRLDLVCGGALSVGIFFLFERLMETNILVQTTEVVPLEGWQLSLCMVPPRQYETRGRPSGGRAAVALHGAAPPVRDQDLGGGGCPAGRIQPCL